MKIEPLRSDIIQYLSRHGLFERFNKSIFLLEQNIKHPSLNLELLEPKWRGIYSFRIDKKYRALFFINKNGLAEIIAVTNHYKK
jgi:Txe/YoeB family toxin of Txe-Axe toxin-antitoxin module